MKKQTAYMSFGVWKTAVLWATAGVAGLATILGMAGNVQAETRVKGSIVEDTVWDIAGSPYIFEGHVVVEPGVTLTIGPGVETRGENAVTTGTGMYVNGGNINILGKRGSRVTFRNSFLNMLNYSTAHISGTDFTGTTGVTFDYSRGTITSSTFRKGKYGIYGKDSIISIGGSRIEGNEHGVITLGSGAPSRILEYYYSDKGGAPQVYPSFSVYPTAVNISQSVISGNIWDVRNAGSSSLTIQAADNWWGSPTGPGAGKVYGSVVYKPWLTVEPPFDQADTVKDCCSSILFIPGLQASRLYTGTNRLWEPNRNEDVEKLYLDAGGKSIDSSVYSGEPIDMAFGIKGIYGSFTELLDKMANDGTIKEWKAFGYDWRKPIAEVVAGHEQKATTTESLLKITENLAARSPTGKVTLIAHSNGGLVAKYLVKTLAEQGKDGIIDSVISVAVPYLGTPQAIIGLLHGDGQSIGYGTILRKSVAKGLGINMPAAYSLIPSAAYFAKSLGPTIAFADGSTGPIDSAADQSSFIGERANAVLMAGGEALHGILDPFHWPVKIARWALVGWGQRTTTAITYSDDEYSATTTSMGDGTVVAPSAAFGSGTTTAVDLALVSKGEKIEFRHANILESSAVQRIISNIVSNPNAVSGTAERIEGALAQIPGVTIGEPDYGKEKTFLVVSTHSPVDAHVYDALGNHTGTISVPAGLDEDVQEGLYSFFETGIPGSSFETFGSDESPDTYISLPDEVGAAYSVVIRGTGIGEFTYKVERIRGKETLGMVEYTALPTTPLMIASTTILGGAIPENPLQIDVDGDGSADIIADAGVPLAPMQFLEAIKKTVITLVGDEQQSRDLLRRIDRIAKSLDKGKMEKVLKDMSKLDKAMGHKKLSGLSATDREMVMAMIRKFIDQFE